MKSALAIVGSLFLLFLDIAFARALLFEYRTISDILISLVFIILCSYGLWKLTRRFIRLLRQPKKNLMPQTYQSASSDSDETSELLDPLPISYIHDGHVVCRCDGQTLTSEDIEYLQKSDFEQAQQYYESSSNPKFHRTFKEDMEQEKYYAANAEYIDRLEDIMDFPHMRDFLSIDEAIDRTQKSLLAAQQLAEYCSKTTAGKMYFEDQWLHLHNSKNPDFSYIEILIERYSDLTLNYEERKKEFEIHKKRQAFLQHADRDVLQVIKENPGVLQKNLHKHFDSDLKPTIGTVVGHLLKADKIRREKCGNSYLLYVK